MRWSVSKQGFTPIELLVVIAIIAILGALLLPTLSRAKTQACSVKCKSNLRQIGVATAAYVTDLGAYPQVRLKGGVVDWVDRPLNVENQPDTVPGAAKVWTPEQLRNFHSRDPGVFACPSDIWREQWDRLIRENVLWATDYAKDYDLDYGASYGYNSWGLGGFFTLGLGPTNLFGLEASRFEKVNFLGGKFYPTLDSQVVAPSDMMAWGDAVVGLTNGKLMNGANVASSLQPSFGRLGWAYDPDAGQTPDVYRRHRGSLNVCFCDGHVETGRIHTLCIDTSDQALRRWNSDNQPHREKLGR